MNLRPLGEKAVSQRITKLAIASCCISLTAFACSVPLLGRGSLYLSPCALLLTLLHHGLIFNDRRKSTRTATDSVLPVFAHPSLSSPLRLPLSARIIMILIVWLAGVTWLAVSTVVASLLGISYSSEEVERGALIAEVLLSLLEANLLMVMVVWCFRERELVYKAGEEAIGPKW